MIVSQRVDKVLQLLPERLVKIIAQNILSRILKKYSKMHIEGMENINGLEGPILFICNHLSNSDGLIFHKVLKEFDPTFVAGVKLNGNSVTNLGMIVVKTTTIVPNTPDKEGLAKIIKILKNGENLFLFPEGTRSRNGKMIQAKRGLYLIAKMSKAKIVPIGIYGSEKLLPISLDGDMKSETFHEADVYINIGKPFQISEKLKDEDKRKYEDRVVDEAMRKIAQLIPEDYRGVYI